MKLRAFLVATLGVASLTLSASAQNQPWLKDRATGEGIGIRTGNLELHPSVSGELGYDSNYFQRADDEDPIISMIRLRITPSLTLSTLGAQRRGDGGNAAPPKLTFRAGVFGAYNELFATDSDFSDEASEQRHFNAGANFALDVLPQRPWGFDLYGDYLRTVEPSNVITAESSFDRDTLRLGLGVNARPGGGLFEWRLGYEIVYSYFERDAFQELNNAQHYVKTRGRWRFLPRTALLYDGHIGFLRYSDATTQNDSQVVQSRIGVNGLVTNSFALLAMGGWTASFYDSTNTPQRNYEGPVVHAEVKWFLLPQPKLQPGDATVGLASIAVGYNRDYSNSYLGDYYRRDRGYGNFQYFIGGGRVLLSAEGGLSHITHSESFFPNGTVRNASFGENRVDAQAFVEYRPSDTVGLNLTGRYNAALDDNRVRTNQTDPTLTDNLQFSRYEVWLGARWFM